MRRTIMFDDKFTQRFWSHVQKGAPDECWIWTASTSRLGYGLAKHNRTTQNAHRIAYQMEHGILPKRQGVFHRCDNRPCVNPRHLWTGTQAENIRDRDLKGRTARGEHNGRAKITKEQALQIIALREKNVPRREVAKLFGISHEHITKITRGVRWAELKRTAESSDSCTSAEAGARPE